MNINRSFEENDLSMSALTRDDIKITPYWLLGFVEGDGSFFVRKGKSLALRFSIGQSFQERILLDSIKEYFLSLPGVAKPTHLDISESGDCKGYSPIKVSIEKPYGGAKPACRLLISNTTFLNNVLIPFFDSLEWQSKKELDFIDWKLVGVLINQGKHYLPAGEVIIEKILAGMNNGRLSTNKKTDAMEKDNSSFKAEVEDLLAAPSNIDVHEKGRIYIKSLKRYLRGKRVSSY
uniref:LAGLIDADG endonuclease n=1 Tax=Juglanconis oblonga TaxID=1940568 RepID=A0A291LIY3_9PEZI|nr:LAGLIDADG endonuclease [Juglanconis oblonga]ATI20388.1 LAGLIDADG endonuclease [Juglanconis oblonga]